MSLCCLAYPLKFACIQQPTRTGGSKSSLHSLNNSIPLVFKFNHLYYESSNANEFLFSFAELAKTHKNFGHAPAWSAYGELHRAYPLETEATYLQKLQGIAKSCKKFQLFFKKLDRYRSILPEQCLFNFDVAIDVMFIRNQSVINAICKQTHFLREAPIPAQNSFTIWETFMIVWVLPYFGVPYNLWADQAKSFFSVQFKTMASSLECNLIPIAVEACLSLVAKRYHDPLGRISNKHLVDHPKASL